MWSRISQIKMIGGGHNLLLRAALTLALAYAISLGLRAVEVLLRPNPVTRLSFGDVFPDASLCSSEGRVLVIATSDRCPHSAKSVVFHQSLIRLAHLLGVPVVVVSPKRCGIPSRVMSLLGDGDRTRPGAASSLGIPATPSILLLDQATVRGVWIGRLDQPQEEAVLLRLEGVWHTLVKAHLKDEMPGAVERLKEREIRQRTKHSVVLDLQDRPGFRVRHLDGAVNIPKDELAARIQIEIVREKEIVVDCQPLDFGACILVGDLLNWMGFQDVWLLDRGANGGTCHRTSTE